MKRMIVCVGLVYALSLVTMGQAKEKSGDGNTEQPRLVRLRDSSPLNYCYRINFNQESFFS